MGRAGAPRASPLTGARLGRYQLGDRLGAGGAASVYLALLRGPHDFERVLAVKVVHEHLTETKQFVDMFTDEANLAVQLVHPNIVHSYELGSDGHHLFLAMEYLAGQPLSRLLERARERGELIPPGVVAWVGARAAEGLAYAHALADDSGARLGLVHRDVSPQNVFLTYDGRVLVIDWGIARAEGRVTQTGLGRIKGKLAYMAPEQLLRQAVDHRADLFALGATLYEAAVGVRPFDAEDEAEAIGMLLEEKAPDASTRVPGFPADLAAILMKALEREVVDRYPDAGEMVRDLDAAAERLGATAPAAEVSALLTRLFAEEHEEQSRAVARLKAFRPVRPIVAPAFATTTTDPTASTIRPTHLAKARSLRLGVAAAGALLLGTVATLAVRLSGTHAAPEHLEARPVTLEVDVEPQVPASIVVGDQTGQGPHYRLTVRRAASPLSIDVAAPGYRSVHLTAIPDKDQHVAVRLSETAIASAPPAPAASAPAAPAPRMAAPHEPEVAAAHAGPTKAPVPAAAVAAPPRPSAAPPRSGKDSLVTEYPF